MTPDSLYAVILAGGSGTRFWPRSRHEQPKQLLDIVGSEPMICQTARRIIPLIPPERTFVITHALHTEKVRACLRDLPPGHILAEPAGRNTAPAVGLAALHVRRCDPDGVMVVLPSDHLVQRPREFLQTLQRAARAAVRHGSLVTLGIHPLSPESGYGYIRLGEEIGKGLFRAAAFVEKPSRPRAVRFLRSGRYVWNSGIFVWKADAILSAIARYLPTISKDLARIDHAAGSAREAKVLHAVYRRLDSISIDHGVLERAENVHVIPADFGWNDVGSWGALDQILRKRRDGNVSQGLHIAIDTTDTLIYSPRKLIATVGVSGLIIVETEDALLVCRKDRAQDVRQVVERLKQEGLKEYL
ncbi:MAG: mannose-1-phosphate guanylyltransferase [Nitrospirae bacterium]|nr:mannose-1-phosphate guanylyltransferase [Nitrospirota bacterium]